MGIGPTRPHGIRQKLRHFPVGIAVFRRHDPAHAVDAALGIGEGAVLFEEGRAGQENVGELGRLVEEQVLHDHAFHRAERRGHVLGIRVGLADVLAFDVEALEFAIERGLEHVRDTQARFGQQADTPVVLKAAAHARIGNMTVARQLVRERAHVA